MLKGKVEREFNGVLFLLPAFIIISIFYIYPLLKTIAYAFFFTGTSGEILEFAGLENFIELFTDVKFYNSLIVTFKVVCYTVIVSLLIALFLAIACNEKLSGIPLFRTII